LVYEKRGGVQTINHLKNAVGFYSHHEMLVNFDGAHEQMV
jgi:hypothetical protein